MICSECGLDNKDYAKYCAGCGGQLGGPDMLGPYELRGELGRGAMARVWRAWDPNLEREVAIKEPLFDPRLGPDVLEEMGRRFVKEARAAARLQHPNIVTVYAADVYGGRPAIVMELIEGPTLGDILERGPLEPAVALQALDQLLDAVGYAHSKGVVHRDIKPDNIFVSQVGEGLVKLADFGIARIEGGGVTHATVMGAVLGTPGYMSPEQATGAPVDTRSDLFSIGVVGYEMLSGVNPFGAGDGASPTTLLYRIAHEPAPELPASATAGLPSDLRPAIMAALAKSPDDRPQTAADFKAMLHSGSVPPGGGMPKWLPIGIVAGACAIVLIFALGSAFSGGGGGGVTGTKSGTTLTSSDSSSTSAVPESSSAPSTESAVVEIRESLGDYSWDDLEKISEEISKASDKGEALNIAAHYKLISEDGSFNDKSKKTVELSNGNTVSVKLVDVYHDDRAGGKGKAGLTFLFSECIASRSMNGVANNSGGWAECSMRSWLNSEFISQLPDDLRSVIVVVNKSTNNSGTTSKKASITATDDKLWLPSVCEICGDTAFIGDHSKSENDAANAVINEEGSQYQAFADMGKTFKPDVEYSQMVRSYKGKATKWWYRTPSPGSTGARFFRAVSEKGDLSDIGYADKDHGVVPGFCI